MKTPNYTTIPVITRAKARQLSVQIGMPQEPYRGYAYRLKDGSLLSCCPDGEFRILPQLTTEGGK